ncbi:hypothetical protein Q3G72_024864 [Acer saccharum]|nr:hypothetical protein Q3G72_024864 [Acer saccharum]
MEVAGEQEAAAAMGSSKEGENLMGPPTFSELENGRFKCVETGHELLDKDKDSYSHSERCRLGLIDFALSHNNPPLNMFEQDPDSRSKLICKLTGDEVNKSEEHIWKHMNGKRFLNKLANVILVSEGNEQKRKRMKNDSDIPRLSPSLRNQLDNCASLKGEQVAARITAENAERDEWFVVKVIHFDRETKEFEVLDGEPGDDEEGGGQR